jgi:hypothetical protein
MQPPEYCNRKKGVEMVFLLAFITWAVLHSLTASGAFKEMVRGWIGARPYDGLYRLVYNAIAVVTFVPVL